MASNWVRLKAKLQPTEHAAKKKKRRDLNAAVGHASSAASGNGATVAATSASTKKKKADVVLDGVSLSPHQKAKYIGLDCEMVGIGADGKQSALARCCMVDFDGNTVYDKFVRPKAFVTDFRTQWSGVRKQDLRAGEAITFTECQQDVAQLLKSKILVGHALSNDLDVLMLSHPRTMIRDTARFPPYMRSMGRNGGKMKPRALRELAKQFLRQDIQTGEHDPGEDARTAMFLYRLKFKEWEDTVAEAKKQKIAAFCKKGKGAGTTAAAAAATEGGADAVADGPSDDGAAAAATAAAGGNKKRPQSAPLERGQGAKKARQTSTSSSSSSSSSAGTSSSMFHASGVSIADVDRRMGAKPSAGVVKRNR